MTSVFATLDVHDILNSGFPEPTDLCKIMYRFGSDKSGFVYRWHTYTPLYHRLFEAARQEPLAVFEVGLGSTDPDIESNMGPLALPGASVFGWREYFPNAKVYGADVDKNIVIRMDRLKTFYVDQLDRATVREMWDQPELRDTSFDIIIDDGHHSFAAMTSFFEESIRKLKPGGLYIVEDVHVDQGVDRYSNYLAALPEGLVATVAMVEIPNEVNTWDNRLIILQKRWVTSPASTLP